MWPFYHRFESSVSFLRVELSPLTPLALDAYPLYSSRGRRWFLGVGVNPGKYLTAEQVVRLCGEEGVEKGRLTGEAGVRVLLVTCPSYLGYAMNPISYYLVYSRPTPASPPANLDPQLGEFVAMISEVHNTPWGQRCHYVHPVRRETKQGECEGWLCDTKDKKMHVSPFMSMHYTYTAALHTTHTAPLGHTLDHAAHATARDRTATRHSGAQQPPPSGAAQWWREGERCGEASFQGCDGVGGCGYGSVGGCTECCVVSVTECTCVWAFIGRPLCCF